MRRFTSTEIGVLLLAMLLFLGGIYMVIWPQTGVVPVFTNDALGLSSHYMLEEMTLTGARVAGVLAILFGTGIAVLTIYRGKS